MAGAAAQGLLPAAAQPGGPPRLTLETTIERLVPAPEAAANGEGGAPPELVPLAGDPEPGDELIYTVAFVNDGGQTAADVRITQLLPAVVRYITGSAAAPRATVMFSIDGGRSFGRPEELTVDDGTGRRVPADASAYTHVRWILDGGVEPGARGFLRLRAVAR